ncbi:unnamed protein product [Cyprideis torosa]|uniref:Uncharacterized protein n=1 Tax=Cyprideis torosa TaxID=163714 RepID=A0A7R8WK38_9CRUS|nr:unnamed protein product [Cyprideis torosa]CAG0902683.1 unnamed protein product [Cyprideis torosa]
MHCCGEFLSDNFTTISLLLVSLLTLLLTLFLFRGKTQEKQKCPFPRCSRCRGRMWLKFEKLSEVSKLLAENGFNADAQSFICRGLLHTARLNLRQNQDTSVNKKDVVLDDCTYRDIDLGPFQFCSPDLSTKPFYEKEELLTKEVNVLKDEFEALRKEVEELDASKWQTEEDSRWFKFYKINEGIVQLPVQEDHRSFAVMKKLQSEIILDCKFGFAGFFRLEPQGRVDDHYGPTNCRIRVHLGLKIPEGCHLKVSGSKRTWAEGECLLFDDSFLHSAANDNPGSERLIFLVDFWHPQLSSEQRRVIKFMFPSFATPTESNEGGDKATDDR